MAMDLIDMELDAVIAKTGKGGRSKGPKGSATKGKGKSRNEKSTKGWGKTKADGAGKGGSKKEKSEKKLDKVSNENKLDMSLEEVVEAEKGKGRGGKSKAEKGKGAAGKGKPKALSLWGGARSAVSKGSSKGKGWGSGGYSGGKASLKGSSKGKGGRDSYKGKGSYKGGYKGSYDYDDDEPRAPPKWSQHDDWRAAEEADDWGSGGGGRGMRSEGWPGAAPERRRPPAVAMSRNAPIRGRGSPERSWAGRVDNRGAWSRVEQVSDDSPPRAPPRARRAAMGAVQQAVSRAAREVDRERIPASRVPRATERVVREEPRQRVSAREEVEPRRRAPVREEVEPRRRAREEAAPPAAPAKRRREEAPAPQTSSRSGGTKKIKVTNVARDLDDQDIKEAFEAETGRITKCILDRSTAYITFTSPADAIKAVETFDRGELNGKTISVALDP